MEYDCEIFDDSEAALDGLLSQARWPDADAQMSERLRQTLLAQSEPRQVPVPLPLLPAAEMLTERPSVIPEASQTPQVAAQPREVRETLTQQTEPETMPILASAVMAVADGEEEQPDGQSIVHAELVMTLVLSPSPGTPGEGRGEGLPKDVQIDTSPLPQKVTETTFDPRKVEIAAAILPAADITPVPLPIASKTPRIPRFILAMAAGLLVVIGGTWVRVRNLPVNPIVVFDPKPLPGRAPNPMEAWVISPAGEAHQRSVIAKNKGQSPRDPQLARIDRLIQNADSSALAKALTKEPSESARRAILSALLARADGADRYLDLVLNPATRQSALAALPLLPGRAEQALLAQLSSPSVARRFAAAKALGTLCHGQMLPELRQMIDRGDHRREALAVLSQCRDSGATEYLRELRRQPSLRGQLDAIQTEMNDLF